MTFASWKTGKLQVAFKVADAYTLGLLNNCVTTTPREFLMSIDDVAISYEIKFEKDHASVKVTYDISVPVGGPALIADFQVTVDSTDLISGFLPGQTAFNGAKFHTLSDPSKDVPVSFTLSSNQGWVASDDDVLRGEKDYDEAEFSD
jgi:hypothetical protein